MTEPLRRGEVWLAELDPVQGSEQAGTRPVIVFQNDVVSQLSTMAIAMPLTTNQRRAALPICLPIQQGEGDDPRIPSPCVFRCESWIKLV